jgi:hypothetical protein
MQALRRLGQLAAILGGLVAASVGLAVDTITLKDGQTLAGRVMSFETNAGDPGSSRFEVDVDDEIRLIPLHKIASIQFGEANGSLATTSPQRSAPTTQARSTTATTTPRPAAHERAGEGEHWLTASSNKRHNSTCKYYKATKGRPCGAKEGIPCKACGG